MSSALRTRQPHEALPPEIYLPLVDSLFKEARTLLVGTLFVIGSILVTYWKTGDPLILYCAIAVAVVACARGYMMHTYLRTREKVTTPEMARRWEYRYGVGASIILALLGLWCFISFSRTNDPFADLVSFSMTLALVSTPTLRSLGATSCT